MPSALPKTEHEIRDPIHVFIKLRSDERRILDSHPVQRLRSIQQLGMSHYVYPGATHKRFEHSLGVMEVATRIYDVVTDKHNITDPIRELLPEVTDEIAVRYWREVVRMAALLHDVGHVPYSHVAEGLLPDGYTHEDLTRIVIEQSELAELLQGMAQPLNPQHVVKLALGQEELKGVMGFSRWESILSEIITGDSLGADRIDYLLRDSYHCGTAYGRFDHYRLIDTMRILASGTGEPALGIEEGGIHAVEALWLARYFMYSQVYMHPVRRVYDKHLQRFLQGWLPDGHFAVEVKEHLDLTDLEVWSAVAQASKERIDVATRLARRQHYKLAWSRSSADRTPKRVGEMIASELKEMFGEAEVEYDNYLPKGSPMPSFPVSRDLSDVVDCTVVSELLATLPITRVEFVFVNPSRLKEAKTWIENNEQRLRQEEVQGQREEVSS